MRDALASFAAFEADLISARTKAALEVVRTNGSKSGRKIRNQTFTKIPGHIEARIVELRGHGFSYARIAETLNLERIPTAQGGACWHPQTVANVVKRRSREAHTATG